MLKADRKYIKKNPSINNLYSIIKNDLDEIESKIKGFTHSPNPLAKEITNYLFKKPGKKIRPAILTLCARLCNYTGRDHILMGTLVEMIHTASLIHDDIIDESDKRRGKATVHTRWGPNITVLLGDYLYINTIGTSLNTKNLEITKTLLKASAKMIEGEMNEYYLSGDLEITEEDYLDILNKKTASLFSACSQIGGRLANADEKHISMLREFGRHFGMSFQLIDDLLDYSGDPESLGKPILSDLREGRITLPLIYTFNTDGHANRNHISELFNQKNFSKYSLKSIIDIVKSNGALDYTFQKANEFSTSARKILNNFPESDYRESLIRISDYMLYRNK
ncbi:MAG: polyprenyl synthetase family protein [Acidobacteriota bacterium]